MKSLFTFILTVLVGFTISAQNWETYKDTAGVKIEYKKVHCSMNAGFDEERVIFKITNNSNQEITLDWDFHLYFNGVCRTCNSTSGEYAKTLTLQAGQSAEGDCSRVPDNRLQVFSKFEDPSYNNPDKQELTRFEFANLLITTL